MRAPAADAWVRRRLIAGTAALFAGRLILSLVRSGPVLVADEIGYLTNARVLTGGVPGQLSHAQYYRAGYSLLLAPFVKLASDPLLSYHLVLALNAALAASLFGLLYLLLVRAGGVAPRRAVWPALAGAVYPSVTVFSQVALSENALLPLVCLWLLAVGELLRVTAVDGPGSGPRPGRAPALWWGAAVGLCGAALWAVHGRMVVALILTGLLAVWLAVRRRAHVGAAVTVLAVLGIGFIGAQLLSSYIVDHNYSGHVANEVNVRFSALFGFHPLLTALGNAVGQAWYMVVSTFGLVVVVVADCVRAVRRGVSVGVVPWLLAFTVLLLLVSAGSFTTRTRPDMLIYGRYAEVVSPVLVALGLGVLASRGTGFASPLSLVRFGALLGGLTVLVVVIRLSAGDPGVASRWNVASLPFLTFQLGAGVLIGAAVVGGVGAWLLAVVAARWSDGAAALAACAMFAPIIAYGVYNPVITTQRSVYPSGWTSPESAADAHGARTVAYDLSSYDEIGLYATQWFLPHSRELLFDGSRQRPPSQFVLSGSGWARAHPLTHAVALWQDRGRNQVLWRLH